MYVECRFTTLFTISRGGIGLMKKKSNERV